jgi:hypothetical protein
MTMKLLLYTDEKSCIWVLDTFGRPPDSKQLGLSLCRSLTLWADGLLVGPLDRENHFLLLDSEGFPKVPGPMEAAAFGAFLRDEGFSGPIPASQASSCWHQLPVDFAELLSL